MVNGPKHLPDGTFELDDDIREEREWWQTAEASVREAKKARKEASRQAHIEYERLRQARIDQEAEEERPWN